MTRIDLSLWNRYAGPKYFTGDSVAILQIQDSEVAFDWLVQSACLQTVGPLTLEQIGKSLEWFAQLPAADEPLLPIGILSDIGRLVFFSDHADEPLAESAIQLPAEVKRAYEDYFLGRVHRDSSFERVSAALARFNGEDCSRGIAWAAATINLRLGSHGITTVPSVIRRVCRLSAEEVVKYGNASFQKNGIRTHLWETWGAVAANARQLGSVLGREDVFEIESGTALIDFGQRIALRQVLREADRFSFLLPDQSPAGSSRSQNVVTNIKDEDTYPVGGFTSISTRGPIESLLHSQLAYMEKGCKPPDLFDVKYLRSELLYYSRDENRFLRRRRNYWIVLHPDLIACRIKDPAAPAQRIILLLGIVVCLIRLLTDWLAEDALKFHICFVQDGKSRVLHDEYQLLKLILQEQLSTERVLLNERSAADVVADADAETENSLVHLVEFGASSTCEPKIALRSRFVPASVPSVVIGSVQWTPDTETDPWEGCLRRLAEKLV